MKVELSEVRDFLAQQAPFDSLPPGVLDRRPGQLRLDEARQHVGLPRYAAHSALTDALATAELLLAQTAHLARRLGREPTLGDLAPVRRR